MSLHDLFHWMRRSAENSRKTAKAAKRQRKSNRLRVNQLERRELLSYWLPLTTAPTGTSGIQNMMLLSDGTVMALGNPNAGSNGTSNAWFQLKPDAQGNYVDGSWTALRPMSVSRLFFPSTVLPNGNVLVLGGEFSSAGSDTNTGESFNPTTNGTGKWTTITSYPFQANFGDEPTEVLNSTTVLTGEGAYNNVGSGAGSTYFYNPVTDSWSFAAPKQIRYTSTGIPVYDSSDEEGWCKLPDGSIITYDNWASTQLGQFYAERYVPSTNTWVDASPPKSQNEPLLSNSSEESGPGPFLLPDGRVLFVGTAGNTAFYNTSTGQWSAGTSIPGGLAAGDQPGAILPNGDVLIAANCYSGSTNAHIYEFNPLGNNGTGSYTDVTPSSYNLSDNYPYMLDLPSGQVLLSDAAGTQLELYNDDGTPSPAWAPSVSNIARNTDGSFTLSGTQLNGMSEGAAYGDDAEMASNYPIVRFFDIHSNAYYARTYNWSSTGVQTSGTPESTQFTNAPGPGVYLVQSVANGIASNSVLDVLTDASHNNITLQVDPANSTELQVVSNGSVWSEWPLGLFSSVIVSEDGASTSVTVDNIPTSVTINEGAGSDSVNIHSASQFHIVTVYGNGNDLVTLGNNGSTQSIQGGVQLLRGLGAVNLVVNDSQDPATHTTATSPIQIRNTGIDGLCPGAIAFWSNSLYGLTVETGTGTNDVNITGTNPGYTIYIHCNGSDTVTFGGASNGAQSISGPVYLDETSGNPMAVNVDDTQNSAAVPGTVYVTSGGITGLAPGAIQWNPQEVGYLTITSNSLGTTFQVESTPTATLGFFTFGTTTLVGNGPDTVTVGDTNGSVQGIQGDALYIDNQAASTSVEVDNGSDTGQHTNVTVSLDSSTPGIAYEEIANLAPANIELEVPGPFGVSGTTILGGTAASGNTYQVYDTPAGGTTLLKTGAGDLVDVYGTTHSLSIDGNGANNTVVIGNAGLLTSITGQVTIENENSGTTALTIDDSADPTNHVTVPVTISSTSITGLAPATIYYGASLSALNIDVGFDNPSYGNGASATQSIYDILSTPSLTTATSLVSGGLDTVNVGNAGSVAGIVGTLYLHNIQVTSTVTHDTVLIDDSQNTAAHTFVGLNQSVDQSGITYQEISFLAPGFIYLADPDVQSARVQFGTPASGTNAVTVYNTAPDVAMTLVGTGVANDVSIDGNTSGLTVQGFSTVGIGNLGYVGSINGGINATGDGAVTVIDSSDPYVRTVTVTSTTVDNGFNPTASVAPWLSYSGLTSLTIDAGTPAVNGVPTGAGNTFIVNSTATMANGTTLNVGGGTATVTVSDTANTLNGIQGALAINGQGKATLTFNDQGTATVQGYDVYANQVTRFVGNTPDMASVSYAGVSHLIVQSGTGGTENLLGVVSTAPGTTTDIYNHGFEGEFALDGLDNSMNGIQGPVHLHTNSSADFVSFDDTGNTVGHTYTLTAGTLTRTGMAPVTFDPMGQVILTTPATTSPGSKINIQAVAAGTFTQIGLGSNDTLTLGSKAPTLGGTLATILGPVRAFAETASTATVILDDSGDMGVEHATLAPDGAYTYEITNLAPNPIYLDQIGKATLDAGKGTNSFAVQGLPMRTTLTVNGGTGSNTLVGPNQAMTWTISGANSGSLGKLKFIHVQNLVGGTASDVFKFSAAGTVQTLTGGSGSEWLDYSAFTTGVTVNLATGSATNVNGGAAGSVIGIRNARGGAGNDTLTGSGGNILVGGGGNDVLTDLYNGSSALGGSLLIGGQGSDALAGGSAGDILIGEATSYDTKNANLTDILKEWDTATSHAAAFAALQATAGVGTAHSRLFWGSTVKDDSAADVLTGATRPADVDWFFAGLGDNTNARHGTDYVNNGLA